MKKNRVKSKNELNWFLNFINLNLDKLSDKDLFGLWVDIRERVYGDQGSLFIPDQSLLEWEKKRVQVKQIQKLLVDLLHNILNPAKISPILNKPLRRMNLKIEKPGKSISDEKSSVRRPPILTSPFKIEVQRTGDKVSLFFSKLEDKLVFDFITALTYFPINHVQKCQRQDCGGYFLKGTEREKRFCSKRCAWIMASRERWRSQPEVEKEKRREYYRRKVRIERAGKE
jgi:hypothetical protein